MILVLFLTFLTLSLVSASYSSFNLECKTGNATLKEYFIRESQKVSNDIDAIWESNQDSPIISAGFIQTLGFDKRYQKCLVMSLDYKIIDTSDFVRKIKKCGAYLCKKLNDLSQYPNDPTALELVQVHVQGHGTDTDDSSYEDLSDVDEASWALKASSVRINNPGPSKSTHDEPIDVDMVGIILLCIAIVIVVAFMILRAVFPLKNFPKWPSKKVPEDDDLSDKLAKEKDLEEAKNVEAEIIEPNHFKQIENQTKNDSGYSFSSLPAANKI